MSTKSVHVCLGILVAWMCLAPPQARAYAIVGSPFLPPAGGVYNPGGGIKALFNFVSTFGIFLQIDEPVHHISLSPPDCGGPCVDPRTLAQGEMQTETFASAVRFHITVMDPTMAVLFTTPEMSFNGIEAKTKITRLDSDGPGCRSCLFSNELLELTLDGMIDDMDFTLRLDLTRPSTGNTTITPLDGGLFRIDSFFDVFTELSINGGVGQPCIECGRMVLVGVTPEPSAVGLLGVGLPLLAVFTRRRRNVGVHAVPCGTR